MLEQPGVSKQVTLFLTKELYRKKDIFEQHNDNGDILLRQKVTEVPQVIARYNRKKNSKKTAITILIKLTLKYCPMSGGNIRIVEPSREVLLPNAYFSKGLV